MNATTILDANEYKVDRLTNLLLSSKLITADKYNDNVTVSFKPENVPLGPSVQFEVEEYNFDTLVRRLVEIERIHGISSFEMFSRYIHHECELDDSDIMEWFDLFILLLGTREIRKYSCP